MGCNTRSVLQDVSKAVVLRLWLGWEYRSANRAVNRT